jgi:hypothetical protein
VIAAAPERSSVLPGDTVTPPRTSRDSMSSLGASPSVRVDPPRSDGSTLVPLEGRLAVARRKIVWDRQDPLERR